MKTERFQKPLILLSLGVFFQIFADMVYAYHVLEPTLIYEWLFTILFTSTRYLRQ
jgi:hypothetical protein